MNYGQMIQFFENIKGLHEFALKSGHKNMDGRDPATIIHTYEFVIKKLNDWKETDNDSYRHNREEKP
jgi:hypothetical protein